MDTVPVPRNKLISIQMQIKAHQLEVQIHPGVSRETKDRAKAVLDQLDQDIEELLAGKE